jgi:hypothetical protein
MDQVLPANRQGVLHGYFQNYGAELGDFSWSHLLATKISIRTSEQ